MSAPSPTPANTESGLALEPLLEPARLELEAFGAIYQRGLAYEREGRVERVTVTTSSLWALVAGSAGLPYEVTLEARAEGPGSPALFGPPTCTCPFASGDLASQSFCKHMVAAAVAGLRLYGVERERASLFAACSPREAPVGKTRPAGPRL